MASTPGPYGHIDVEPGIVAPFYMLRFDKRGRSGSPLSEAHLVDSVAADPPTDVFVFCHGWNNDWADALSRYTAFIEEFQRVRKDHGLGFGRPYRPLLVGVVWPSTALVLPWEGGPEIAGDGDAAEAIDLGLVDEVAAALDPGDVERFYALTESERLDEASARELLGLVAGVVGDGDPDLEGDPGRDIDDMLASWAKLEATLAGPAAVVAPDDFGAVGSAAAITEPGAAGFLDKLDPRNLVRGLTVWQMKDRAGAVGAHGVGPLLRRLLDAVPAETRFHLTGHSYGARILLTALAHGDPLPRPVNSLLLLQPAVNHLCFADQLPNGRSGGFRGVLGAVKQPILSTFSAHDFPLTKVFHLTLRRGSDLGEAEIAADEPPNEYAALGGYGPRGFDRWKEVVIKDPTDRYDLGPGAPAVWAIDGAARISGHGAVVNPATAWALFNLAEA